MTDQEPRGEDDVRAALRRYAGRFEPAEPEWARIECRHIGAARRSRSRPRPRRKLTFISVPVLAAATVILSLVVLTSPEGVRTPAVPETHFIETVGAAAPQYAAVVPVPTFAPDTAMAAIQARGFIRVGVKFDQPNFGVRDPATGEIRGFDVEVAKLIAVGIFGGSVAEIGDRMKPVEAVSRNRETLVQDGGVDVVVATYSITPERAQQVDFAGPYFRARQDIMVKSGDTTISSVDDLNGKRVCTARGSTSYQNLNRRSPGANVVLQDTYSECAKALSDGDVDAVTTDQPILAGYAHQSGGTFKVLNNPFSDELYGIGIRKGDQALLSFLNDRLARIVDNGDWARAARFSLSDIENLPPPIGPPPG